MCSRYGTQPTIEQYVKVAAEFDDKSVRDVALRYRWTGVSDFENVSFIEYHMS